MMLRGIDTLLSMYRNKLCTSNAFASLYVLIRFVFVVDGTVILTEVSDVSHKLTVRRFSNLHLTIILHVSYSIRQLLYSTIDGQIHGISIHSISTFQCH